ncbi:Ig-like domain-containing protein [Rhizobium alvei]|uniref:Ig-like domain-containing protein n=1 Tax=Rhizobium alvei TaxID=1132659 RepID=A0ABT8YKI3_9HYPH|nr:Ig-like domain-containing protein [Rhizobium alvei]MDO6963760.1 Ig-like domain-containing protein [Rhizobium alvei]
MTYTITSTTSGVSTTTITSVYDAESNNEGSATLANGSTVTLSFLYDAEGSDLAQTLTTSDNVTLLSNVLVGADKGDDSDFEAYSKAVALPDGGYAIAWRSFGTTNELYVAVYDSTGNQIGDDIRIDTGDSNSEELYGITVGTDGTISVLWQDGSTYYETLLNNGPQSSDFTADLSEDGSYTFSIADFDFTSSTNATLVSVKITSVPTSGSLLLNGVAVEADTVIAIDDVTKLVWTPDADANGNGLDGLEFQVIDSDDVASTTYSVTFDVAAVADLPTAENNTVTLDEDGSYTFSASDFGFADVDGDTLASITITNLPTAGTLTLNGNAVEADDVIDADDIANLVYTPDADASGLDGLDFKVTDSDGDTSATNYTITFSVNAVQDEPTTEDTTVTAIYNTTYQFTGDEFPFADVDGDSLYSVVITSLPTAGALYLDNVEITDIIEIDAADLSKLTWVPPTDWLGDDAAVLEFKVWDDEDQVSEIHQMTFDIVSNNTAPVAVNDKASLEEGKTLNVNVLANDTDGDDDNLYISDAVVTSGNGSVDVVNSVDLSMVGNRLQVRYNGDDLDPGEKAKITINYTITDGSDEDQGKLTVTVTGVAEPGDDILGTNKADRLNGTNVGEMINGLNGKDSINGNGGDDRIYAGLGNDVVDGGAGDDRIFGAGGNDDLTGGNGADSFIFRRLGGIDTISDFTVGTDSINIEPFNQYSSLNDLKSVMSEVGGDVLIELGSKTSILIEDMKIKELNADCFLF